MSEKEKIREGWVSVFRSSTDYEADMARDRLDSSGIPAAVFTQRDHALNLTVGGLASVYVLVPPESADEARAILQEHISDEELDAAADRSQAESDGPTEDTEELLDSGIESIHLDSPEDLPDDEYLA